MTAAAEGPGSVSEESKPPAGPADPFYGLAADGKIEFREGFAEVGDVRLHYVEAGAGPLIVLLHGFPEFWYGWRLQIAPLAAAGFRVVAPDARLQPVIEAEGFEAYAVDLLADDIRGLIGELGAESALMVGHDWGGSIAWTVAMNHPEVVDPTRHPQCGPSAAALRGLKARASSGSPGTLLLCDAGTARMWWTPGTGTSSGTSCTTRTRPTGRGVRTLRRGVVAARGSGRQMISCYGSRCDRQKETAAKLRPLSAKTLVIWGERIPTSGPTSPEPDHDDVPNLDRVGALADASHWVHHDEAERVNQASDRILRGLIELGPDCR
jgi:pimeloyl-ACP methyl ester carboxylesterase